MEFTPEQLENVEKYASLYLTITDIAYLLGVHADRLRDEIRNKSTAVSLAYYNGKAASKLKIFNQEMLLAQVGSPAAIENAHRHLMDMEDDE